MVPGSAAEENLTVDEIVDNTYAKFVLIFLSGKVREASALVERLRQSPRRGCAIATLRRDREYCWLGVRSGCTAGPTSCSCRRRYGRRATGRRSTQANG